MTVPSCCCASEPTETWTANHRETGRGFTVDVNRRRRRSLVGVTHSAELAARFPKNFELIEGSLGSHDEDDGVVETAIHVKTWRRRRLLGGTSLYVS